MLQMLQLGGISRFALQLWRRPSFQLGFIHLEANEAVHSQGML